MSNIYNLDGGVTVQSSLVLLPELQAGLETSLLQAQTQLASFASDAAFTDADGAGFW